MPIPWASFEYLSELSRSRDCPNPTVGKTGGKNRGKNRGQTGRTPIPTPNMGTTDPDASRPPNLIQHALPQDAVRAGLVALARLLQPGDDVGVETHGEKRGKSGDRRDVPQFLRPKWEPRIPTRHARRISSSMRCRRMRFARVWYPLPGFFSQAMTSASRRRETACFTGR